MPRHIGLSLLAAFGGLLKGIVTVVRIRSSPSAPKSRCSFHFLLLPNMRAAVVPPVEKDGLVRVPSTAASAAAAFACQHHHHSTTATDEYGMMQCDIDNDGDHNRKIKRGHVFCGACCAKNCRCCCRHGGCCNSNDCCDMRRSVIVVNIFHGFFLCLIFLGQKWHPLKLLVQIGYFRLPIPSQLYVPRYRDRDIPFGLAPSYRPTGGSL
jgi:hypothetical protein